VIDKDFSMPSQDALAASRGEKLHPVLHLCAYKFYLLVTPLNVRFQYVICKASDRYKMARFFMFKSSDYVKGN
jgi:hypothetical protein